MIFNKLPEGFEQVFITDCEDSEWTVAAYKGPFDFRENQPIYYLSINSIKQLNDCWAKEAGLDWSNMPMFVNVYDEYYIVPDVNGKQEKEIIENIKDFIHYGKDLIEHYPCFRLKGTDLYSFSIPWNWIERTGTPRAYNRDEKESLAYMKCKQALEQQAEEFIEKYRKQYGGDYFFSIVEDSYEFENGLLCLIYDKSDEDQEIEYFCENIDDYIEKEEEPEL